jgi:hypothetical protein
MLKLEDRKRARIPQNVVALRGARSPAWRAGAPVGLEIAACREEESRRRIGGKAKRWKAGMTPAPLSRLTRSDYPATFEMWRLTIWPASRPRGSAALADPATLVEWNHDNSSATVSELLDLEFDAAMQFILEAITDLDPACFCESRSYNPRPADVYQHHARGREWYVKLALNGGRERSFDGHVVSSTEAPDAPGRRTG